MKRNLLKVLMVMALGAVICLPGVAAAGINLNFNDLAVDTSLVGIQVPDYNFFTWAGDWTVGLWGADNNKAVFSGSTSTISSLTPFKFDGADFALNGATFLTITGTKVGGGTVVFPTEALGTSLQTYSFANFPGITQLTFSSDGGFVMDNLKDVGLIPLPPTALLLGSGLLGLVGLGWRKRKTS